MHKNTILAVGITILFLGLAIQPSVATVQPKEEIDIEPKDYLFQTIIDIANNPDVKNLLEQYNHKIFTSNYDYKGVFSKLLFRKPRLLFSMFFTKPSITYDYLDKCYNRGIEVTNILGEDKALEIMKSIKVTNPELFDEFNKIIVNDVELSKKLTILKEMNEEYISDFPFDKYPIICSILFLMAGYGAIKFAFFLMLSLYLVVINPIISKILGILGAKSLIIWFSSFVLLMELECIKRW